MRFCSCRAVAIGEAMIEMAPVGDGLYRRGFAGDTYNTIWHMAQLLGNRIEARFATRIGMDALSDNFLKEMERDGLDPSAVTRDAINTMGLYLIALNGAERSFSYWRESSAARLLAADGATLKTAIAGAGLIHLSGITLAILDEAGRHNLYEALADARVAGAVVSFDPNLRLRLWTSLEDARTAVETMLQHVDIALPSLDDEQSVWGDAEPNATIQRFAEAGVQEVVVKNGPGPVTFLSNGNVSSCDTPTASKVIDTSGAGDSFNSGYLSARLVGLDPLAAIGVGQKMAAEVLRHYGARAPKELIDTGLIPSADCRPL